MRLRLVTRHVTRTHRPGQQAPDAVLSEPSRGVVVRLPSVLLVIAGPLRLSSVPCTAHCPLCMHIVPGTRTSVVFSSLGGSASASHRESACMHMQEGMLMVNVRRRRTMEPCWHRMPPTAK